MSCQVPGEEELVALLPFGPIAQGQPTGSIKTAEEELKELKPEDVVKMEEEVPGAADVTLPWPGDRDKRNEDADGASLGDCVSDDKDDDGLSKAKWRESMPEGDKWRDDPPALQRDSKGDGSLADDEEEEEENEEEEASHWVSEKGAMGFTPQVTVIRRQSSEVVPQESRLDMGMDDRHEHDKDNARKSQTPLGDCNELQQNDCEYNTHKPWNPRETL